MFTLRRSGTRPITKPLRSIRPEHRGTFHTQFWLAAICLSLESLRTQTLHGSERLRVQAPESGPRIRSFSNGWKIQQGAPRPNAIIVHQGGEHHLRDVSWDFFWSFSFESPESLNFQVFSWYVDVVRDTTVKHLQNLLVLQRYGTDPGRWTHEAQKSGIPARGPSYKWDWEVTELVDFVNLIVIVCVVFHVWSVLVVFDPCSIRVKPSSIRGAWSWTTAKSRRVLMK